MSTALLYCQRAGAACDALGRPLTEHGVDVETHDVSTDPDDYDTVTALGYRSVPVLVTADGASAAGAAASEPARQLTSSPEETIETNSKRSRHGGTQHTTFETPGVGDRHTHHHLASELRRPPIHDRGGPRRCRLDRGSSPGRCCS